VLSHRWKNSFHVYQSHYSMLSINKVASSTKQCDTLALMFDKLPQTFLTELTKLGPLRESRSAGCATH
jgi:hypothetical protein